MEKDKVDTFHEAAGDIGGALRAYTQIIDWGESALRSSSAAPIEEAMDAKRYRWLREQFPKGPYFIAAGTGKPWSKTGSFPKFVDAAIDAAMAKEPTNG